MKTNAVTIQNLGYAYPKQINPSLSDVNLEITAGQRFGLFGPNGAGKTTLMNCLTGLLTYKQGKIFLLGKEVSRNDRSVRELFGFVPQDFSFYPELTPKENMEFFGAWYGLHKYDVKKRTTELLEVLGLSDVCDKQVREFSGGMKRRVNLAIAVMHEPQLLFLDEPTVGVDVQSRIAIIHYLKSLNKKGTTLVYTSHQLNEAEDLCEVIAMIDEGKIVAHDNLKNLLAHHKEEGLEGLFLNLTGKAFRD